MEILIGNLITLCVYYLIFRYGIYMERRKIGKKLLRMDFTVYAALLICVIGSLVSHLDPDLLGPSIHIYCIWVLLAVFTIFKIHYLKEFLIIVITVIFMSIYNMFIFQAIEILYRFFKIEGKECAHIIASILILFLLCILYYLVPGKYEGRLRMLRPKYYIYLLMVEGLSIFGLIRIKNQMAELGIDEIKLGLIVLFSLIFLNLYFQIVIILSLAVEKGFYKEETEKYEQIINEVKLYEEYMDDREEKTRRFRHDIKAHMGIIANLVNLDRKEEVQDYIKKMKLEINCISGTDSFGDEIVDVVINKYMQSCKKLGVDFQISGHFTNVNFIKGYDFCTILSNLLENAQEAAVTCENPYILLTLSNNRANVIISCENSYLCSENSIVMGKTSKKDKYNHGYGLLNIQECVKKYDGRFTYHTDEDYFRAVAVLHMLERDISIEE